MATTDFLPAREADLLNWSLNFKTKITAAPTTYGLVAGQATTYGTLHDAFNTAYIAAVNDASNSSSAIVAKNTAKTALIANARLLARIVQAAPAVTNAQKSDLGLTVRDTGPSPIPPPASAPDIDIISATGNTVRIRLHDPSNPTRRGKPAGVDGAAIFSFVGATAPDEQSDWKFEGNITRTSVDVVFPSGTAAGAKVWFTAFWFNERKQNGPAATPVGINIPGGAAMAA
jgi:hypothetical protein